MDFLKTDEQSYLCLYLTVWEAADNGFVVSNKLNLTSIGYQKWWLLFLFHSMNSFAVLTCQKTSYCDFHMIIYCINMKKNDNQNILLLINLLISLIYFFLLQVNLNLHFSIPMFIHQEQFVFHCLMKKKIGGLQLQ